VVCSPRTPPSRWINREVERFRELGRGDRILSLLIEGEPRDAFPAALVEIRRTVVDAAGNAGQTVETVEPLAADVRATRTESLRQRRRLATLRLMACLLGVGFDDLRQREQERRARRMAFLGAGLAVLLLLVSGLAGWAIWQTVLARNAENKATATSRDLRRSLADFYVNKGLERSGAGDLSLGLLWYVKALEAEPDNLRQEGHLTRIGDALWRLPRIVNSYGGPPAGEGLSVAILPHREVVRDYKIDEDGTSLDFSLQDESAGTQGWDDPKNRVHAAVLSPDGARVYAIMDGKSVQAWDAQTHRPVGKPMPCDTIDKFTLSPDGRRLLAGAQLWNTSTFEAVGAPLKLADAETDDGPLFIMMGRFTRDGNRLVIAGRGESAVFRNVFRVFDAETGAAASGTLRAPDNVDVDWANASLDGRRLITNDGLLRKKLYVWDAAAGKLLAGPLKIEATEVADAHFSNNGRRLLLVGEDQTVRVCNEGDGFGSFQVLTHEQPVSDAQFTPNGRMVLTVSGDTHLRPGPHPYYAARAWDVARNEWAGPPLRHDARITAMLLGGEGTRVATVTADGDIHLFSPWDQELTPPLVTPAPPRTIAFDSEGRHLHVATNLPSGEGAGTQTLVWNTFGSWRSAGASMGRIGEMMHGDVISDASISPDGRQVVTASEDKSARLWDAATGRACSTPMRHPDRVTQARFSPDSQQVATGCADGRVRVWSAATGRPLGPAIQAGGPVSRVLFTPDGRSLIVAAGDVVRLWGLDSRQPASEPIRTGSKVGWISASADGRRLAIGSEEIISGAGLFDVSTGKRVPWPNLDGEKPLLAWFAPRTGALRVVTETASKPKTYHLWDGDRARTLSAALPGVPAFEQSLDLARDRLIATTEESGSRLVNSRTGEFIAAPIAYQGKMMAGVFTAERQSILAFDRDEQTRLWDSESGRPLTAAFPGRPKVFDVDSVPGHVILTVENRWCWLWDLSPERLGPAEDLSTWAELVSGRKIDPTGAEVCLTVSELVARLESLRQKCPERFKDPRPEASSVVDPRYVSSLEDFAFDGNGKSDDPAAKLAAGRRLGDLALQEVEQSRPFEAAAAAKRGLELAPDEGWIRARLAIALGFAGEQAKALSVCRAFKDLAYKSGGKDRTFARDLIDDLDAIEHGGMHNDVMFRLAEVVTPVPSGPPPAP